MLGSRPFCGRDDNFVVYEANNMYIVDGKEYVRKCGTRREVYDEVCFCTSGKLKKEDLIMKNNKLVSKRRSEMGRKRFAEKGNPFKSDAKQDMPDDEKRPQPKQRTARRRRKLPVLEA